MKLFFNKIHYPENFNLIYKLFETILRVPSLIYLLVVNIRNFLYDKNLIKKHKLDAYVIAVGNLTTGGTGKTPITVEIAKYLNLQKNKKVAILSRGYGGGLAVKNTNIVSDGKNIFYSPELAGDEPYWMAMNTDDVAVITGKNRIESGQKAIEKYDTDTLILDDGFQHRKLERDLNILVIDCYKKLGNNLLLPAGPLREPFSQIKRADKIILVNKKPFDENIKTECEKYSTYLSQKFQKPVYLSNFTTIGLFNIKTKAPIENIEKIYAFAGIAQPEFFFNELTRKGFEVVQSGKFTDHHMYTEYDLKNILKEAKKNDAQAIITTEKDAVKLSMLIDNIDFDIDIFALKLGMDLKMDQLFDN